MFEINAQVSHPGHGACRVTDICELNLTGEAVTYYKLIPYHGASETVYIPVTNADKIGLRRLISKNQAHCLLHSLSGADEQWLSDSMAKQRRYRSLFANNTVENLHETLSAMSAIIKRQRQKELGSVDKAMLETIQNKAMSELALALDISVYDAIRQAEDLILQIQ
jgi:CarD family transcriptional regulator